MALGYLAEEKKQKRKVQHYIADGMREAKITHKEMSEFLEYQSRQVFDYKLANMTFDVYELKKIFRKLKFSDEEILDCMKGES